MATCKSVQERLNALLDRELSVFDWFRVRLHLSHCAECRKCLADYHRISRAADQVRLVSVSRPRNLVPAFALSATVLAVFALAIWPKPKQPQALVFDKAAMVGNLKPSSAIYAEGDHLVLRDPKTGMVLATSPGQTRLDAFNIISLANKVPLTQPKEVRIALAPDAAVSINEKDAIEIVLLEGGDVLIKEAEPTVVFFTGDSVDLKTLNLPSKGPAFFVKIIDPGFLGEVVPDHPLKKNISPSNNKPESINR